MPRSNRPPRWPSPTIWTVIQRLPNIAYRIGALFSRQMRYFLPDLNSRYPANVDKARKLLGWAPRSGRETVIDCGRSLAA